MPSRKAQYLEMAKACHDNARKLYLDSLALRKRKSRGHAYSLLVLSVEETVKALVYRLAVDGLIELSDKEKATPIGLTEKDLLDHKVKHGILADVIISSIVTVLSGWPLKELRRN